MFFINCTHIVSHADTAFAYHVLLPHLADQSSYN